MIEWNKVTWYSKLLAIIIFVGVIPTLCFYIGGQYKEVQEQQRIAETARMVSESEPFDSYPTTTPESTAVAGDISYVMKKINGFDTPQIVNYPNATVMQKVNKYLADNANSLNCAAGYDEYVPSSHDYYDSEMKVTYAQNNIFSISHHIGYYCAGPYPTNDLNVSVTFDMTTGEVVPFKDLFANYAKDGKALLPIVFASQIKENSGTPSDDMPCNGVYSLVGDTAFSSALEYPEKVAYTVEKNGIYAQVNFPHVMEVCSEGGFVPIENLKTFLSPTSILHRVK